MYKHQKMSNELHNKLIFNMVVNIRISSISVFYAKYFNIKVDKIYLNN